MKIIKDDCIYVQLNDVAYASCIYPQGENNTQLPKMMNELLYGGATILEINTSNQYDFVKFSDKETIEFFKQMDDILDYDKVKDFTPESILGLADGLFSSLQIINLTKNSFGINESVEDIKNTNRLMHQYQSLMKFYLFLNDEVEMQLPEGIETPTHYKKQNQMSKWFKSLHKNAK